MKKTDRRRLWGRRLLRLGNLYPIPFGMTIACLMQAAFLNKDWGPVGLVCYGACLALYGIGHIGSLLQRRNVPHEHWGHFQEMPNQASGQLWQSRSTSLYLIWILGGLVLSERNPTSPEEVYRARFRSVSDLSQYLKKQYGIEY